MVKRILAVAVIFLCSWVGWGYLSRVMDKRTWEASMAMSDAVGGLWGTPHVQQAPGAIIEMMIEQKSEGKDGKKGKAAQNEPPAIVLAAPAPMLIDASDINIALDLEHRKKGLLWFATYTADFKGRYTLSNPVNQRGVVSVRLLFPSGKAVYDKVAVAADGAKDFRYAVEGNSILAKFTIEPNTSRAVEFGYQARGLDQWSYAFGEYANMVKNFTLTMTTNFSKIDFPKDSVSPDVKEKRDGGEGWKLVWNKQATLVSNFGIGMIMPKRLNPGPMASAMSSHAPVSLLFFFFIIFLLQTMRGIKIHPMNYFFLACGFFAFNLLFAYLVDHLEMKASFVISSLVSILLVVSYLRLVVGARFALVEAGISQFTYQVLFSFAHFFEGYTGLAITIGAIITLAIVMQLTGRIDWEERFKDKGWGSFRGKKPVPGINS